MFAFIIASLIHRRIERKINFHVPGMYPGNENKKGVTQRAVQLLDITGTGGRNRTDMDLTPLDFESYGE